MTSLFNIRHLLEYDVDAIDCENTLVHGEFYILEQIKEAYPRNSGRENGHFGGS